MLSRKDADEPQRDSAATTRSAVAEDESTTTHPVAREEGTLPPLRPEARQCIVGVLRDLYFAIAERVAEEHNRHRNLANSNDLYFTSLCERKLRGRGGLPREYLRTVARGLCSELLPNADAREASNAAVWAATDQLLSLYEKKQDEVLARRERREAARAARAGAVSLFQPSTTDAAAELEKRGSRNSRGRSPSAVDDEAASEDEDDINQYTRSATFVEWREFEFVLMSCCDQWKQLTPRRFDILMRSFRAVESRLRSQLQREVRHLSPPSLKRGVRPLSAEASIPMADYIAQVQSQARAEIADVADAFLHHGVFQATLDLEDAMNETESVRREHPRAATASSAPPAFPGIPHASAVVSDSTSRIQKFLPITQPLSFGQLVPHGPTRTSVPPNDVYYKKWERRRIAAVNYFTKNIDRTLAAFDKESQVADQKLQRTGEKCRKDLARSVIPGRVQQALAAISNERKQALQFVHRTSRKLQTVTNDALASEIEASGQWIRNVNVTLTSQPSASEQFKARKKVEENELKMKHDLVLDAKLRSRSTTPRLTHGTRTRSAVRRHDLGSEFDASSRGTSPTHTSGGTRPATAASLRTSPSPAQLYEANRQARFAHIGSRICVDPPVLRRRMQRGRAKDLLKVIEKMPISMYPDRNGSAAHAQYVVSERERMTMRIVMKEEEDRRLRAMFERPSASKAERSSQGPPNYVPYLWLHV